MKAENNISIKKENLFSQQRQVKKVAFLRLGFRPFFLGGACFSVLSILFWMLNIYPNMAWHAHEMIYGYGLAIFAGFLLTAVKNWTGIHTLNGFLLLGLFIVWVIARVLPLFDNSFFLFLEVIADNLFIIFLIISITIPIVKARQWRNINIVIKAT